MDTPLSLSIFFDLSISLSHYLYLPISLSLSLSLYIYISVHGAASLALGSRLVGFPHMPLLAPRGEEQAKY